MDGILKECSLMLGHSAKQRKEIDLLGREILERVNEMMDSVLHSVAKEMKILMKERKERVEHSLY